MFEKIKELFNKPIKEANELDTAMKELKNVSEQSICEFESNTNDCSLVQQLKEKQAIKRIVDADIKAYNTHNYSSVQKFRHFLLALEENGFRMNNVYVTKQFDALKNSEINNMFLREGTRRLEYVLDSFSLDDIDNIANELKALKQKIIIVEEKKATSNVLANDIANIKAKLGID